MITVYARIFSESTSVTTPGYVEDDPQSVTQQFENFVSSISNLVRLTDLFFSPLAITRSGRGCILSQDSAAFVSCKLDSILKEVVAKLSQSSTTTFITRLQRHFPTSLGLNMVSLWQTKSERNFKSKQTTSGHRQSLPSSLRKKFTTTIH
jgi:hypothetical protein